MSRQEALDALYAEWRVRLAGEQFIPCGLVDEATYAAATTRTVFVLKEAVADPTADFTLPGYLQGTLARRWGLSRTWSRAGGWAYAIEHGFTSWSDHARRPAVDTGLRLLGMTNLKKSGGSSSSTWKVIAAEAERLHDLWTAEIRLMSPDLVVCGGTWWIVQRWLPFEDRGRTPDGIHWGLCRIEGRAVAVIEAWHPAYWKRGADAAYRRLGGTVAYLRGNVLDGQGVKAHAGAAVVR